MNLGIVIGTIVATQKCKTLESSKLCIIQPVNEKREPVGKPLIATDSAAKRGYNDLVYYVESYEAATTGLLGEKIPVDAAVVGIVDEVYP